MMGNCLGKPTKDKMEDATNCKNSMDDKGAPPMVDDTIESQKYILKINAFWFILICEKRGRRPVDVDSDDVVVTTVE